MGGWKVDQLLIRSTDQLGNLDVLHPEDARARETSLPVKPGVVRVREPKVCAIPNI
jgi:hypothetical protein